MTNKKIISNVSEELINLVEAYQYEVNSRKDLISYMITNNMDINTDAFKQYQTELVEFTKKLDLAKSELDKNIIQPFLTENNITSLASWNLDFTTKELTITWSSIGDAKDCSCKNGQCKNEA